MKKLYGLFVIFGATLLLAGCGGSNTFTCSLTETNGDEEMTQEVVMTLDKDGKVESYDLVLTMASEESAEAMATFYESAGDITVKRSGKEVTIKDAQKIEEEESSIIGKTKDEVKELLLEADSRTTCK